MTNTHDHAHDHDHGGGEDLELLLRGQSAEAWDGIYSEADRRWSGRPNEALVVEVADLTPGTALDIGCGEGADTVWLAQQGWSVTGLDISGVALERARAAAEAAGVQAQWIHAGLADVELPDDGYDLVSVFYPALPKEPAGVNLIALLGAVAPGGTLLYVGHADLDPEQMRARGYDPEDYLSLEELQTALTRSSRWDVTVRDRRPRSLTEGAGAGHTHDEILRATRSAD